MKLSMEWLSEFVNINAVDIKDYCARMTDTGSKVESYELLAEDIQNVVVGEITEVAKHPDADKLSVCKVKISAEGKTIQVVTAASNVFAGAFVPVCAAPASLPGGVKIKAGKLRGVESQGMFCSIEELALTLHEMPYAAQDGILILQEKCAAGDDIRDVLKLRDTVVEFEITPNRPDCLSVIGLARETGASFGREVNFHTEVNFRTEANFRIPSVKGSDGNGAVGDYLTVEISAPEKCFRYSARIVKNVKIAPSPLWMRMRLRAMGVRPINNIVDITNYVMLEYGQPMHAFDHACISGKKIEVREAVCSEKFTSLDNTDHTLAQGMLVISDMNKAVALAGVMGGANSEIKDSSSSVVFESANFLGTSVRATSRALGMRTESSLRFEKGLDPENTLPALERACELVEALGAGEVVDGVIDVYPGKKALTVLPLETEKINKFLGSNFSEDYMRKILASLDFRLDGTDITVPSYRADIKCMNDIAEEIIRIHGYNAIESTLFSAKVKTGVCPPRAAYRKRLGDLLCGLGLNEIYTLSFVNPKWYDKINLPGNDAKRKAVVISNPLGEDTGVMRTVLLPSMLETLARNYNYRNGGAALFETSAVYIRRDDPAALPDEHFETVIGMYGDTDFYDLKGVCEAVVAGAGIKNYSCSARDGGAAPYYHPGRSAVIAAEDGAVLGALGEIHPSVARAYGFDVPVYAAVIEFEEIFKRSSFEKSYTPLPKYPAVTRDFAFICGEDIESAKISETIKTAGGKLVCEAELFDIYKGSQIPDGKKSVAYSVVMRAADRTLTDEEADKISEKILAALGKELGVTLRT